MSDNLENNSVGWSELLETQFQAATGEITDAVAARIIREDRGMYRARSGGKEFAAEVTGAFRHGHTSSEDYPAVGDWVVAVQVVGEEKLRIHAVLPRRTVFKRTQAGKTSDVQVVAANVDTVFIVIGVDGDFNARRAERYVALAYESGARPVVVLSKCDLVDGPEEYVGQIEEVAIGVPVHAVSSIEHEGLEALGPYLNPGETVACLGSSGAGKSTLINVLVGEELMDTGGVREDDSRGRHTTTHRQLIALPNGGSLIDTPGMRELQLTGDEESVDAAFADVEALVNRCQFGDCGHGNEPGCAVREAIESGELDAGRYRSYEKLQRELDYVQRRQSEHYDREERQRGKAFNRMYKRIQQEKKNR